MKLIFETSLKGHRYEYLHNLFVYLSKQNKEKAVFLLPFDERIVDWNSVNCPNVKVEYLAEKEILQCNKSNLLIGSYYKSQILTNYVHKYNATSVFLIFLMLYMPILIFFLPKDIKVSGIIYRSFLWEDSLKKNYLRKAIEWFRYWLMAKSSQVYKILLLNDNKSASVLNARFATDKFIRLPDPYTPLNGKIVNIKEKLNISKQDNLFIQIGQLSFRKGTLEILDALRLMSSDEVEHNYFFFAGKVASEIHESFYSKVNQLKDKGVHLYIKDKFVSFEFLNSLCSSCDCMLTPYKNTSQSSGAIGYAAQYGKPVIGPSKGLLGYLIKHYKLGYQVNMVCAKELYQAITSFKRVPVPDDYVKDNQMNDFLKLCLE